MLQHTLFDTAVGRLGIAWQVGEGAAHAGTLWAVQLPEPDDARTTARLLRGAPPGEAIAADPVQPDDPAVPAHVQRAMAGVVALMQGERDPLTHVALDMGRVPTFHRKVYEITRQIPPGQTRTYGELARELGDPAVARAVGQALGANPFAPIVPCHRILAASGFPGGFSAAGGIKTKLRLLEIERASFGGQAGLF